MKIASLPETDHAILSSDQSTNSNPGSTRTADEDLLTYPRSASVTEDDSHAIERVQSNLLVRFSERTFDLATGDFD